MGTKNKLTVMTYNLLLSSAMDGLNTIVQEEKPDVFAVQEIMTKKETLLESLKKPYALADFSNCHIKYGNLYGIATYYNRDKIKLIKTETLKLSYSLSELFLLIIRGGNIPRTMLRTVLEDKKTKKQFYFYNLHLSPYASNGIRKKQMKEAFDFIVADAATIITGDFNFPYMRRDFEKITKEFHLHEATNTIRYSFKKRFMGIIPLTFNLDYILYKNIKHTSTKRLDHEYSDHFPILGEFEL